MTSETKKMTIRENKQVRQQDADPRAFLLRFGIFQRLWKRLQVI